MSCSLTSLAIRLFVLQPMRVHIKETKSILLSLCEGNSPVTAEFPTQMASNVEKASMWYDHNGPQQVSADGITPAGAPACISNYTHYNAWNEITYPFLNFNGATVEV